MTAPQHRRPVPAVVFIAVLTVLTAIVWVRVLSRASGTEQAASTAPCTTPRATLPTKLPYAQNISVIVLNSTNRPNLAAHTKKELTERNFRVVTVANDEPSYGGHGIIPGVGEIRFGPTSAAAATTLHYFLPRATMVRTDSSAPTVILSLGEKFRSVQSRRVAEGLMAKHSVVRTTASPAPLPAPEPNC